MGIIELPAVSQIRTPGFVESFDATLETKCVCGGFSTSGLVWRMWLIYGIQILFIFLSVVIGSSIQSGVGNLGNPYNAVDILRLVGGLPGILAALLGGVGIYIRMRYLMMGTVILDTISILFLFISWAIDAADAAALSNLVANGAIAINFVPPKQKATAACIFGAFGWVVTIIAFYLTYAAYQELDGSTSSPNDNSQEKGEAPANYTPEPTFAAPTQKAAPPKATQPTVPKPKLANDQTHNCPQCSSEWPIDVKFCGECGSKIPDVVPEPQPPQAKPGEVWEEHFTDDGFMYYYNPKTGESKWAES